MWPLIEIAVEPRSKFDQEKLGIAIEELLADDTTLRASTDTENKQAAPALANFVQLLDGPINTGGI